MNPIEIIGYTASILVAISLTMSQILKLRVINLLGAITFSIYGFLVGAYPVLFVNSFITFINIYYLYKFYKNKDSFEIINARDNPEYFAKFYNHYFSDILNFFPEFKIDDIDKFDTLFILRNLRPVNLVVYRVQDNNIAEIILDYSIKEYRDFLNGKYLLKVFKDINVNQLVTKTENKQHQIYLKRIGFVKNDFNLYVKKI